MSKGKLLCLNKYLENINGNRKHVDCFLLVEGKSAIKFKITFYDSMLVKKNIKNQAFWEQRTLRQSLLTI